ncbi:aminotransferase class I/II-fold pyridoxal phosphate-dependent enzyme [Novosphingobium sp. PASSN1]|uniref:aminotransferase class I/II-fold pyridoxal phosphate-dependent enzyme n=1 Tax=Novosphingobium sp. PASSN1 TaxID=2015561 RepID=UPI000BC7F929|nr:aminotransferase class I/II-fold pyridoxal phosphate-dependent enzyme [Novosphingobium sp. PASSN1]OYU34239.1 MAG: aminotransferase [Novosphingobium sp. PASSN1]
MELASFRNFALEVYFSKWEFAAKYHLTASDAQSMTLSDLLALASPEDRARFDALHLGYTETFGSRPLRETIAGTYDHIAADDLLCFAGAEEGIYVAMRVLLRPEDHAIVITPNYQAAETIPLSICAVTGVALDADAGWALDIDKVRAALRPNTRLISICFPNNPTGAIPSRATFDALVELCRAHGLWLFSDEVYRLIERDPALRLPQVADVYDRGVSLNVMSKSYGLPGLRIGWLACRDRGVLAAAERYKHYLSICNAGPSELLAEIALKARDTILARNRALVRSNLALLDDFFAGFPDLFDWRHPDSSCVAFIRYRGADGVEAFCERLVAETGVLLLPASIYRSELGPVPADHFRIGFGRSNMADALAVFGDWLRARG